MCGIAGIFNRDHAPVDPETLVRMTRTLAHRGPDEEGYFVNRVPTPRAGDRGVPFHTTESPAGIAGMLGGDVGLGHRRLSIIDLAHGQQPLCNEDGSIWVSFNGEIYNFESLMTELE